MDQFVYPSWDLKISSIYNLSERIMGVIYSKQSKVKTMKNTNPLNEEIGFIDISLCV